MGCATVHTVGASEGVLGWEDVSTAAHAACRWHVFCHQKGERELNTNPLEMNAESNRNTTTP